MRASRSARVKAPEVALRTIDGTDGDGMCLAAALTAAAKGEAEAALSNRGGPGSALCVKKQQ